MSDFAESLNLADSIYLCDIFGSVRENQGDITIQDLVNKIDNGATILSEENMSPLLDHHDAVAIFMGAGDVQKFELAYETLLSHSSLTKE